MVVMMSLWSMGGCRDDRHDVAMVYGWLSGWSSCRYGLWVVVRMVILMAV